MRMPAFVLALSLFALTPLAHTAPAIADAAPNAQKLPAPPPVSKSVSIVELDAITVLALSQADGRAVLSLPDKQMVVVKNGDPVPRSRAVLTEVLVDKLVLHEKSIDGKTRQMVWMHKGQGAAPGRIDRFATEAVPGIGAAPPLRAVIPLKGVTAPARKP